MELSFDKRVLKGKKGTAEPSSYSAIREPFEYRVKNCSVVHVCRTTTPHQLDHPLRFSEGQLDKA